MKSHLWTGSYESRRPFIGGSDARIIMGSDEAALVRLWREKRGEAEPEDLRATSSSSSGPPPRSSIAPGTSATPAGGSGRTAPGEALGHSMDGGDPRRHRGGDGGRIRGQVHAALVVLRGGAAEKYMAQLQHNMWVTHLRTSVLSIITGGGKWVEITIPMDPLYLSVLVSAEKKFWRCVQSGEVPHLINAEPPRPRIEAIRIVDMSASNSWAEFAALFRNTREAFLDHERAKSELKALMPEDAKEAIGHGVRAKRSKSGAVSFDVLETEASHAPVQ